MSIEIPERLSKKLENDKIWLSNVMTVITNVEKIFLKEPYFFEEYTNHNEMHINHILEISDKLMHKKTLKKITSKTLGVYLISAILHDIGMYITYNHLKLVIERDDVKISLLDKYSMRDLWDKYLVELKRYTGTELNRKFGTTEICFNSLPDADKMTTTDKLVVGEFIRQNHHKISHYIINNMVNLGGIDILPKESINNRERDLIGLIARSHGTELRSIESYLKKYGHTKKPMNIEVFYLMSLIRLSDYLDAGEERASHIIEEMYVHYSEISKDEFAWNQCIKYSDYIWEEKFQRLTIEAFPKNGSCFSKVTKWIKSVQQELDLCWAIISEFYSVNDIKFSIRRIDSSVLNEYIIEEAEENFYPDEVKFQVNPDILKLLIQPLYGDDPSYGVRELVQNAVDACREREEIEKQKGKSYSGEIKVNIDTTSKTFTIEDNGTGMTVDTIINYYLKAGSSYRRSSTWGEDFFDADGKPKVLRNGKFGIGVLATFLLGAEATITTKSIKDDKCWKFTIKLDQDNIEITRTDEKDTYGTIVSVKLSDKAVNELTEQIDNYDCWYEWYVDSNPTIEYKVDGQIKERDIIDPINEGWFELEQDEYEKYYWSYGYDYDYGMESYCNGIGIPDAYLSLISDGNLRLNVPYIYTLDKKGIMPVNLSRNKLTEIPCRYLLLEECFKCYLAQVLKLSAYDIICSKNAPRYLYSLEFQNGRIGIVHSFIYTKNGFYPIFKNFRKYIGVKKYQVLYTRSVDDINLDELTEGLSVILFDMRDVNELRINEWFHFIHTLIKIDKIKCIYINKSLFALKIGNLLSQEPLLFDEIKIQEKDDYFVLTKKDDNNDYETDLDVESVIVEYHEEYSDDESDNSVENNIMMKVLNKYFPKDTWIPYNMEERKRVFAKAFDELKKYM